MENAIYATLTRQSGLMREMQTVANNIANLSTTGFRKEGVIFAEHVSATGRISDSLSMATAGAHLTDTRQGALSQTGGRFDFSIEGDGFFLIDTPDGPRLTRDGAFTPNAEAELVTSDGYRVLDSGGAPIFIPPDAVSVSLSADGTLAADGRPITQIGAFLPVDPLGMARGNGVRFKAESGTIPAENALMVQGFLESSNVNAVTEVARMIEVQRAYEMGQAFLEKEDERIRSVAQTLGR